jgi:hypothetical protein
MPKNVWELSSNQTTAAAELTTAKKSSQLVTPSVELLERLRYN